MKAILVIDMPNDCDECPLNSNGYCDVLQEYALLNEWVEDAPYYSLKEKGSCPLKPIPKYFPSTSNPQRIEYLKQLGMTEEEQHYYELGHDDCIDEILGEQK